jgi:hypothetical protein
MPNANDIANCSPKIINRNSRPQKEKVPSSTLMSGVRCVLPNNINRSMIHDPSSSAYSRLRLLKLFSHEHDARSVVLPGCLALFALVLFRLAVGMLVDLYEFLNFVHKCA